MIRKLLRPFAESSIGKSALVLLCLVPLIMASLYGPFVVASNKLRVFHVNSSTLLDSYENKLRNYLGTPYHMIGYINRWLPKDSVMLSFAK